MHEMDLQNVFYTLGIVVMSLLLIVLVSVVAAIFYIRNKINRLQQNIEAKIDAVFNMGTLAKTGLATFSKIMDSRKKRS